MPKPEWGVKRVCPKTGKRFYDLNKSPIVSPYTGEIVEIDSTARKGAEGARAQSKTKQESAKSDRSELEGDDAVLVDDNDTTDDADLLEDDGDDTVALDDLADVAEKDDES